MIITRALIGREACCYNFIESPLKNLKHKMKGSKDQAIIELKKYILQF